MRLIESSIVWAAIAGLSVMIGCASAVAVPEADSASDSSAAPDEPMTEETVADCLAACGARAPAERTDGWCAVTWSDPDADDCVDFCEQVVPLLSGSQARDALVCIDEDPVCYTTMEQCVGSE